MSLIFVTFSGDKMIGDSLPADNTRRVKTASAATASKSPRDSASKSNSVLNVLRSYHLEHSLLSVFLHITAFIAEGSFPYFGLNRPGPTVVQPGLDWPSGRPGTFPVGKHAFLGNHSFVFFCFFLPIKQVDPPIGFVLAKIKSQMEKMKKSEESYAKKSRPFRQMMSLTEESEESSAAPVARDGGGSSGGAVTRMKGRVWE